MNLIGTCLRILDQYRAFRATLATLAHNSDHDLARLGLERGELARAAYTQAERQISRPVRDVAAARGLTLAPAC